MEYITVAEAIDESGLRLVLGPATPGPWGEAAKAVFHVKRLPYTAVAKPPEGERVDLLRWTRQTSAPVAMYERERPRSGWSEILFLAERLAPEPRLVPRDPAERLAALGLAFEICGETGLGWSRRLMILPQQAASEHDSMPWKYGLEDETAVSTAADRVNEVLGLLARALAAQRARGERYLVGQGLSAPDLYWATFSNMVAPMSAAHCPMPGKLREIYESSASLGIVVDPTLIEHRDFIFEEHLALPMVF